MSGRIAIVMPRAGDETLAAVGCGLERTGHAVKLLHEPRTGKRGAGSRDLEHDYGVTLGQVAQEHGVLALRYAPGVRPRRDNTLLPDDALRALAEELEDWEKTLRDSAPMVVVSEDAPLPALLVAGRLGRGIRSFRRLPLAGAGYWSRDRHGSFPAGLACDGNGRAVQLIKERVQAGSWRSAEGPSSRLPPASWLARRRDRRLLGGGFALSLPSDAPTFLFVLEPEPSRTLARHSPDFTNQHVAIVALSRDLPAGARIAVLEHPSMFGNRPVNFLRHLRDLKNVWLMPEDTSPSEAIASCSAIAGIGGNALLQAVFLGKPALVFGDRFPARDFANVAIVEDIGDLSGAIARCMAGSDERSAMESNLARLAEVAFVAADPEDPLSMAKAAVGHPSLEIEA